MDYQKSCEISNLNQKIQALAEGEILTLEPREYHLYEENTQPIYYPLSNTDMTKAKNIGLLLKGKSNITLDGNGATLVCHGRMQPITLDSCQGATIRNLAIDWEIPLSAEGVSLGFGNGYTDFSIDATLYPHSVKEDCLYFQGENWEEPLWKWGHTSFDPMTGRVLENSGDCFCPTKAEALPDGTIRLYADWNVPKGAVTVLRHNPRRHAGIFVQDCCDTTFDNITIHGTGGLGILCQFSENLTFHKVSFKANESRGRKYVCGHDDGIHLSNDRGNILVEDCFFHGLMDDCINLHGVAVQIEEIIDEHTAICRFMHNQATGFDHWATPGQRISILDHNTMASIAELKTESFQLKDLERFEITFQGVIPKQVQPGDALENLSNTASMICRRNYFGPGRARGVLVTSPQSILIENNWFETTGSAILFAGDANQWFESGACHDVQVRGNTFTSSCLGSMYQFCEGIISLCPEIPNPTLEHPFHTNIRIENNLFHPHNASVLYAFSVEGLTFSNNIIARSNPATSWHPNPHMITLSYCKDVEIEKNNLIGEVLGKDVYLSNSDEGSIQTDLVTTK